VSATSDTSGTTGVPGSDHSELRGRASQKLGMKMLPCSKF
jgi:hypothetical protein